MSSRAIRWDSSEARAGQPSPSSRRDVSDRKVFTPAHEWLLLELVGLRTATPLETEHSSNNILEAQRRYADGATRAGFAVVHHAPADPAALSDPCVPAPVRVVADRMGPEFLVSQPNLVLRLGPPRMAADTLAFNFHMDTVDGGPPPARDHGRVRGRGAIDAKGPGVALLAGIEAALARRPSLPDTISVLIQCVSGEEGGAMGVYGSKVLAAQGFTGRLNVYAEPSGEVFFDRATASMTARVAVTGQDAIDDAPEQGHNATVLLGHVATSLALELDPAVRSLGGRACIAGVHTGRMHNRVYGSGELLINFAYDSAELGALIEELAEEWLRSTARKFSTKFADSPAAARAARDVDRVLTLNWLKRGLPPLENRDDEMEALLARACISRLPDALSGRTFTCDAIWGQSPSEYTIVYGPGDLAANGAHTDHEFVAVDQLDRYARDIAALVLEFADAREACALDSSKSAAAARPAART